MHELLPIIRRVRRPLLVEVLADGHQADAVPAAVVVNVEPVPPAETIPTEPVESVPDGPLPKRKKSRDDAPKN